MSHTPGPWTLTAQGYAVYSEQEARMICWTAGNEKQRTPEAKANATLISAAPDLLVACKVARLDIDSLEHNEEVVALLAALDAAISKATGANPSEKQQGSGRAVAGKKSKTALQP